MALLILLFTVNLVDSFQQNDSLRRQSPIDIVTSKAEPMEEQQELPRGSITERFKWENFRDETSITISLENDLVKFKPNPKKGFEPKIKAGIFGEDSVYSLSYGLLHFNVDDNGGSEHMIDKQEYPLEAQFYFFDSVNYKSFDEATADAMAKKDTTEHGYFNNIVCFSVLFLESAGNENIDYKALVDGVEQLDIDKKEDEITVDIIQHLLPRNVYEFYVYNGSFTVAPYLEVVTWVIFKEKVLIDPNQVHSLRRGKKQVERRELSLLSGRKVLFVDVHYNNRASTILKVNPYVTVMILYYLFRIAELNAHKCQ